MKQGKYQVAIIGCGAIAKYHAQAVVDNKDITELFAVCDIIKDKAVEFAKSYNVDKVFENYIDMLKQKEIDIVCICTPSGLHSEQVVKCAEYGKNVLCEKPLDINTESINRMSEAYAGIDQKIGLVFQYRTFPGNREAKKIIESGELGKVLSGNGYCKIYRSQAYYDSAGWRGTWKYDGGGCLMNQAIHTLDILSWFCGGVKSVIGKTYTLSRQIEVEDTATVILDYNNGAKGVFYASTLINPGVGIEVEIICEQGKIIFSDPDTYLIKPDANGKEIKTKLGAGIISNANTANDPKALSNYGHVYLLKDLVSAIDENREVFIPVKDGRHVVDVILSIYESSKENKEVIVIT